MAVNLCDVDPILNQAIIGLRGNEVPLTYATAMFVDKFISHAVYMKLFLMDSHLSCESRLGLQLDRAHAAAACGLQNTPGDTPEFVCCRSCKRRRSN